MRQDILQSLIDEEIRKTGNLSKVARDFDLNYAGLRARIEARTSREPRPPRGPEPVNIGILGRPGLRHCVIAVKRDGDPYWPKKYREVIMQARTAYDAGTHEMATGLSQDGWVVLYLIPLERPVPPRIYFGTLEQ